ncbi:hypothetical protein BaRGS_00005977, partial [Batillaria attramentaria]
MKALWRVVGRYRLVLSVRQVNARETRITARRLSSHLACGGGGVVTCSRAFLQPHCRPGW